MESSRSSVAPSLLSLVRPVSPLSSRLNPPRRLSPSDRRSRSPPSPLLASKVMVMSYHARRDRSPPVSSVGVDDQAAEEQVTRRVVLRSHGAASVRQANPVVGEQIKIDRTVTCPILIRLSYATNGHHSPLHQYDRGHFPRNELCVNTWIDASLAELAAELKDACRMARRPGTRLHFVVIYPDKRGAYRRRELGTVIVGYSTGSSLNASSMINGDVGDKEDNEADRTSAPSHLLKDDSDVTLLASHFHVGDYIDVAIQDQDRSHNLGGWSAGRRPMGPMSSSTHYGSGAGANKMLL